MTFQLIPGGYVIFDENVKFLTQEVDPELPEPTPMTPERATTLAEAVIAKIVQERTPPPCPKLVVEEVRTAVDGPNLYDTTDNSANIPLDSNVLLTGWLEILGQRIPVTARFRVPVVKRNRAGSVIEESLGLAEFTAGALEAQWKARQLGRWEVLEDEINRDLPPEKHMTFSGLTLYVY